MLLERDTTYTYRRHKFTDGHHLTKVHLFRTDWRRESPYEPAVRPPATTACGVLIFLHDLESMEQVIEKRDFEERPFIEPDDCKTCCRALESGTLGIWLVVG